MRLCSVLLGEADRSLWSKKRDSTFGAEKVLKYISKLLNGAGASIVDPMQGDW